MTCPGSQEYKNLRGGAPLVFRWLRLCASTSGDAGSIPGRVTKIPCAMWCSQRGKKQKETNKQTCQGCSPSLILGGLLSWLGAGILVSSPSPDHPGVLSLVSLRSHCLLFQIFLSSPPGVSHPVVCSFVALSQIRSCYPV